MANDINKPTENSQATEVAFMSKMAGGGVGASETQRQMGVELERESYMNLLRQKQSMEESRRLEQNILSKLEEIKKEHEEELKNLEKQKAAAEQRKLDNLREGKLKAEIGIGENKKIEEIEKTEKAKTEAYEEQDRLLREQLEAVRQANEAAAAAAAAAAVASQDG